MCGLSNNFSFYIFCKHIFSKTVPHCGPVFEEPTKLVLEPAWRSIFEVPLPLCVVVLAPTFHAMSGDSDWQFRKLPMYILSEFCR